MPSDVLEEFRWVYGVLVDALYFGIDSRDPGERGDRPKGWREDYFFKDWRLLRVKAKVDRRLAAIASSLCRWARSRKAGGPEGPPCPDGAYATRVGRPRPSAGNGG